MRHKKFCQLVYDFLQLYKLGIKYWEFELWCSVVPEGVLEDSLVSADSRALHLYSVGMSCSSVSYSEVVAAVNYADDVMSKEEVAFIHKCEPNKWYSAEECPPAEGEYLVQRFTDGAADVCIANWYKGSDGKFQWNKFGHVIQYMKFEAPPEEARKNAIARCISKLAAGEEVEEANDVLGMHHIRAIRRARNCPEDEKKILLSRILLKYGLEFECLAKNDIE